MAKRYVGVRKAGYIGQVFVEENGQRWPLKKLGRFGHDVEYLEWGEGGERAESLAFSILADAIGEFRGNLEPTSDNFISSTSGAFAGHFSDRVVRRLPGDWQGSPHRGSWVLEESDVRSWVSAWQAHEDTRQGKNEPPGYRSDGLELRLTAMRDLERNRVKPIEFHMRLTVEAWRGKP